MFFYIVLFFHSFGVFSLLFPLHVFLFSFFSFQSFFFSSLLFLFSFVISIMFHLHLAPTPFILPYCFIICFVSPTISWCLVVLIHVLLLHLTLLFCITPHLIALCSTTPLLLYFVTYCFTSPCYLASCFVICFVIHFMSHLDVSLSHPIASPCPAISPHPPALFYITPFSFLSHLVISPHLATFYLIVLLPPSPCCFLACPIASCSLLLPLPPY